MNSFEKMMENFTKAVDFFSKCGKHTKIAIIGIIVIIICVGCWYFSPTQQATRAANHTLETLAELGPKPFAAYSNSDIEDIVDLYPPVMQNSLKADLLDKHKVAKKESSNRPINHDFAETSPNWKVDKAVTKGNEGAVAIIDKKSGKPVFQKRMKKIDGDWYMDLGVSLDITAEDVNDYYGKIDR